MTAEKPLDDWLHDALVGAYGMERETWAVEKVERVIAKLNRARRRKPRLEVRVLGLSEYTAFIAPGRFIYLSRRLLERLPTDDAVAMVLAHEAAHCDLGHFEVLERRGKWLPRVGNHWVVALAFRAVERQLYTAQMEQDADERGFELCLKAGYEGEACLRMFDILKQRALDLGDLDGVFAPDPAEEPIDWLLSKARSLGRRSRHAPLDERKAHLKEKLKSRPPARKRKR